MRVLTKAEYERIDPRDDSLDESSYAALRRLARRKTGLLATVGDSLKTKNWVGVARGGCVLVEVLPKTERGSGDPERGRKIVARMISSLLRLPKHRELGKAQQSVSPRSLLDAFFSTYLDELEALLQIGLRSGYEPREERTTSVRGRICLSSQDMAQAFRKDLLRCAFDDRLPNTPMNRYLLSALRFGAGSPISASVRFRAERVISRFEGVESDDLRMPIRSPCEQADRSFAYYRSALTWAELILSARTPTSSYGDSGLLSLAFPMEKLFESYVSAAVEGGHTLSSFKAQSTRHSLATLDAKPVFTISPDMVGVDPSGRRWILDCKWKLLDSSNESCNFDISQADMYQLAAYAGVYRATERRPVTVALVYPMTTAFRSPLQFVLRDGFSTVVWVVPFDIECPEAAAAMLSNVLNSFVTSRAAG